MHYSNKLYIEQHTRKTISTKKHGFNMNFLT